MSCAVDCRHGSDPVLLWLWCRPAAIVPIPPQAWEPPHATGAALKSKKQTDKKNQNKQTKKNNYDTITYHTEFLFSMY